MKLYKQLSHSFLIILSIIITSFVSANANQLYDAVNEGNLQEVQVLIEQGASIHQKIGKDGLKVLHLAAFRGHTAIISYLIRQGANVNTTNERGETPLHYAARFGQVAAVKKLVKKGADCNLVAFWDTPLDYAYQRRGQLKKQGVLSPAHDQIIAYLKPKTNKLLIFVRGLMCCYVPRYLDPEE